MNMFAVSYHSIMCDMRYIQNGIHMRGEIHFAFEDRNMAPVPPRDFKMCDQLFLGAGRVQLKILQQPEIFRRSTQITNYIRD